MLVCDPVTLELRFHSRNFAELTKFPGEVFPGIPIFELLGRQVVHDLRNAAAAAGARGGAGWLAQVRLPWSETPFDVRSHTQAGATLVELEPSTGRAREAERALDLTRHLVQRMAAAGGAQRLFTTGARLVQALLGFDRAMVCRFQPDGSARVVAEARLPVLDSCLGRRFPPRDLPPQARALYLASPVRAIPDAAACPVPLDPPVPAGQAPVDMSQAQLRGASAAECAELRAAGARAALTLSLVIEGELWGLIVCHHREARVVPPALRLAAELFAQYFAVQIASTERNEATAALAAARVQLDGLMRGLAEGAALADSLPERLPALAALMGCHGAALLKEGRWSASPDTLDEAAGRRLLGVVQADGAPPLWHTQAIAPLLPGLSPATGIAGALVVPLSGGAEDSVFLFRRSDAPPAGTAGHTDAHPAPGGEKAPPRSAPWTGHDLALAEALRSRLRDALLAEAEALLRARDEAGRRRAVINAELNHRIKNVLALVKSIAVQTGASATSVADYAAMLEGRLHALASAHDQSLGGNGGSLAGLIEAEAVLHRSQAAPERVAAHGPDLHLDAKAYGVLALVMHEMMTNAVKYGALSVPEGRLSVTWAQDPAAGLVIDWRESGGPAVVPPRSTGFGSRLIRSSLEYDLRGRLEIDFDPRGLAARLVLPAHHLAVPAPVVGAAGGEEPPVMPLAGQSVLVVEDQGLIAMDTEESLRRLGATDIRLAASGAEALALLDSFRPDLAVLDFNLGEETSEAVATALMRRNCPFLFMTGYSDHVMLPPAFGDIPVVRKPVASAAIALNVAAARAAVGRKR